MQLQQLLNECRNGSITAQKYLYDLYATQMFLVCNRYLKNSQLAEESMLNGFFKVFKSLNRFDYIGDESTNAWIKKIMVNECLQQLRNKNNFLMVAEDEAFDIPIDESVLNQMSAEEIYRMIAQLPLGYRTVFNLYVIEGMTHKEIATALGVTEGTSKSQLSKGKQMLQKLLIKNNSDHAARKAK